MRFNLSNDYDVAKFDTYCTKLKRDKKNVELSDKQRRTIDQNALFHAWIKVFADFVGEVSIEACKQDIKRYFLGTKERVNRITGEVVIEDYKTSEMTTEQLADFMNKFKIWAQGEGCYLPYWKDAGFDEMISRYE